MALVAVSGFLAVALGAFAAHGLKPYLDERAQEWFKLATTYQMWHTLALLGLAATWIEKNKGFRLAAWGWLIGVLLFAGSLYLMAVTGNTRLAFITPIGGLALLLGWLSLFVGVVRSRVS
ncbi:MAG: DUF423 domain-containing protein [Pseudomonadaceae bacterium]|nr:DUF423 domain-containing protein [Pseudomonadaceae bacterium]